MTETLERMLESRKKSLKALQNLHDNSILNKDGRMADYYKAKLIMMQRRVEALKSDIEDTSDK